MEVFPNIRSAKWKKRKEIVGIIGKSGAAFTFGLASMIIGGETPIPEFETKTYLERLLSVWLYVKLGFYGAGVALFLKANSLKEREALARKQLDYLKSLAQ